MIKNINIRNKYEENLYIINIIIYDAIEPNEPGMYLILPKLNNVTYKSIILFTT